MFSEVLFIDVFLLKCLKQLSSWFKINIVVSTFREVKVSIKPDISLSVKFKKIAKKLFEVSSSESFQLSLEKVGC